MKNLNFVKLTFSLLTTFCLALSVGNVQADEPLTTVKVLESSKPEDWRKPDPGKLLLLELENGEVLFELAEDFAPRHIDNIRKLVAQKYFDGLAIIRSQDNYVVQWGDSAEQEEDRRALGKAAATLDGEYFRAKKGLAITPIQSRDAYADQVGFVQGFPVGSDADRAWLTHCYGMLGAGRGGSADSGNGAELYVVTGHSPRHLDRNVTLIGRALSGVQHLSSLPRGSGPLGFYENPTEYAAIKSIRFGSDLPPDKINIEVMRTDTQSFKNFVQSRTHRMEDWFLDPTGKIEICNIAVPMRKIADN